LPLTPRDDDGAWRERATASPASILGDPPASPWTATEREHQQQLPLGTPVQRKGSSALSDAAATAQRGGGAGSSSAPSAAVAANQVRLRQIQDSMMDDVISGLLDTLVDEIQLEYLLGGDDDDDDDGDAEGNDREQTE
jgi:hypothetical protein